MLVFSILILDLTTFKALFWIFIIIFIYLLHSVLNVNKMFCLSIDTSFYLSTLMYRFMIIRIITVIVNIKTITSIIIISIVLFKSLQP